MPKGQYDRTKSKQRETQREKILSAAMNIYAQFGFEGATMERMAKEAGVSRALVSAHFGDKQGLIRAAVSRSVEENLALIAQIDQTPGLTLRMREQHIFSVFKRQRETWRLIYGTLLVPQFQFDLRKTIETYMETEYKNLLCYLCEFKDPSEKSVRAFSYTMLSLRQQYVLDGRESAFHEAQMALADAYLFAEQPVT